MNTILVIKTVIAQAPINKENNIRDEISSLNTNKDNIKPIKIKSGIPNHFKPKIRVFLKSLLP